MANKNPIKQIEIPTGENTTTTYDVQDNTLVAGDNITITTNLDGERVISAAAGGGIPVITSNLLIIWNTDAGIYKLAPGTNGPMDICWYGTDTTSSSRKLRVTRGVGEVYLYITNSRSNSTSADINFKSWYIIYMITNQSTGEMPNIAVGWTSASQGAILNYNLKNSMYMEPTTTGNKLVLTTTTSNKYTQSTWSTAGFLKTNTSGQVSVDNKIYEHNIRIEGWTGYYRARASFLIRNNVSTAYTTAAAVQTALTNYAGTSSINASGAFSASDASPEIVVSIQVYNDGFDFDWVGGDSGGDSGDGEHLSNSQILTVMDTVITI